MEAIVRPGLVRVVLTGSESVGKTTLAGQLARHFGVEQVPEFVRAFAERKGTPLDAGDVGRIARGQMALEDDYALRAGRLLIQDTDLLSTVVYSHHYYGSCPDFIEDAAMARRPALYLLPDIDVPWVPDGVRDRGDRRAEVQQAFIDTLQRFGATYHTVSGTWAERTAVAVSVVEHLLNEPLPARTSHAPFTP